MSDSARPTGNASASPVSPADALRATIDLAPLGIAHFDISGRFLLVNDRLCEILGHARPGLLARTFQEITFPDDLGVCLEMNARLAAGEVPRYQLQKRFVRGDGSILWARITVSAALDAAGHIAFFIGIAEDISNEIAAEQSRRAAEERLRVALDASHVGAFQFDVRRNALTWSDGVSRLFGGVERQTLEEFFELIHPDDRAHVMEEYLRSVADGVDLEMDFRVVWPDGSVHWLHDRGCVVFGADGAPQSIVGALTDVTNHYRMEEVIRRQEARFQTLVNEISQLAWIADRDGNRSWFNQRWFDYTGGTLDEMCGLGWLTVHDPSRAQEVLERQRSAFRASRPWEDTVRLRGRDGEYRWFLARAMPVPGEDGDILHWLGTDTDITDRLAAEERLRESEARMREALEMREQMLAFVAHDLRNPVQTIAMAAAVLERLPNAPDQHALDLIRRSASRMDGLIGDLLDVNMMEAGTFTVRLEPLEVDSLVDEVAEMFAASAATRALALEVTVDGGLPTLRGDPGRLLQVMSNLVGNALKFTPAGGQVRMAARAVDGDVVISVQDTGGGIAPEHLAKIFDRFWQVNRQGGGVGLGLAIVRGIVEAHGGRVGVESTVGAGTTFHVTLPAGAGPPSRPSATHPHGRGAALPR